MTVYGSDILRSTQAEMIDREINGYQVHRPFREALHSKALVSKIDGTYAERPVSSGSPGTARRLDAGNESFSTTRLPSVQLLRMGTCRIGGAISITGAELDANKGKQGALKLIERGPVAFLAEMAMAEEAWLLTGQIPSSIRVIDSAVAAGWTTLNGQFATGVGTGVLNGLLDFAAPASQTDVVHELAKSTSYHHYNQYAESTGWAADGMASLRSLYRVCTAHDPVGNGPDMLFADSDTFTNIDMDRLAQVRTKLVEDKTEKSSIMLFTVGKRAELQYSVYLDRTLFSAGTPGPDDGLVYFLNTDYWENIVRREPTMGNFEDRSDDKDILVAKFLQDSNFMCLLLKAQGVLVGTAV